MKKWAAALALAGAVWMIVVLSTGSLFLANLCNYPGVFAGRWVHYRGIAPSSAMIWSFDVWLVLTSAIEWIVVGLGLRALLRHLLKGRRRQLAYKMEREFIEKLKSNDTANRIQQVAEVQAQT